MDNDVSIQPNDTSSSSTTTTPTSMFIKLPPPLPLPDTKKKPTKNTTAHKRRYSLLDVRLPKKIHQDSNILGVPSFTTTTPPPQPLTTDNSTPSLIVPSHSSSSISKPSPVTTFFRQLSLSLKGTPSDATLDKSDYDNDMVVSPRTFTPLDHRQELKQYLDDIVTLFDAYMQCILPESQTLCLFTLPLEKTTNHDLKQFLAQHNTFFDSTTCKWKTTTIATRHNTAPKHGDTLSPRTLPSTSVLQCTHTQDQLPYDVWIGAKDATCLDPTGRITPLHYLKMELAKMNTAYRVDHKMSNNYIILFVFK